MSDEILLSARDLTVRFGGVLAVNKVSFDVKQGEVFTLIGPNGAGKTTVFNLISRIYTPTAGEITYLGQKLTAQPPHRIASLGIARTFQNIELFEHATVLHNLLIGRHTHHKSSLWSEMLFTAKVRRAELQLGRREPGIVEVLSGLTPGDRVVVEGASNLRPGQKVKVLADNEVAAQPS